MFVPQRQECLHRHIGIGAIDQLERAPRLDASFLEDSEVPAGDAGVVDVFGHAMFNRLHDWVMTYFGGYATLLISRFGRYIVPARRTVGRSRQSVPDTAPGHRIDARCRLDDR